MAPSPSRALLFRAASARSALWKGQLQRGPDCAWRASLPAFPGVSDRRSSRHVVPPYCHRDVYDPWVESEAQRCRTLFRPAAAPFGDTMWDQSAADALATQETDDRLDLMKWIAARD